MQDIGEVLRRLRWAVSDGMQDRHGVDWLRIHDLELGHTRGWASVPDLHTWARQVLEGHFVQHGVPTLRKEGPT